MVHVLVYRRFIVWALVMRAGDHTGGHGTKSQCCVKRSHQAVQRHQSSRPET